MRFHSKPIEEHQEVPLADEGRWEALVAHWEERESTPKAEEGKANSCFVVAVHTYKERAGRDGQLAEIVGLVQARGDRVVGQTAHELVKPHPRTLLRSGVAARLAEAARAAGADLLVIDAALSPSQMRNLEDVTGLAVCDREAVILEVFQRNASTRRARMQVEIAHLEYLRPRIRGIGLDMDQQAGGIVGGKGAGETASELLARRLDGRLADLRSALGRLKESAQTTRSRRESCDRVVLVGYTNAGKTSLMNALTRTELSARDRPFETLDTTSRCLSRHGGNVLLSDTVGFIRKLPERLLASFESTLAEIREASLLGLVLDLSDPEVGQQQDTTEQLLEKLGAGDIRRFYIFNKTDRLASLPSDETLRGLSQGHEYLALSSQDDNAVQRLKQRLLSAARHQQKLARVFVPYEASALLRLVYGNCRVLEARSGDRGTRFLLEGPPHVLAQLSLRGEKVNS